MVVGKKRVTEEANELTTRLDEGETPAFVRRLREVDMQLFTGWRHHPSVYDPDILRRMTALSDLSAAAIAAALRDDGHSRTAIVFSGCGTSGRMAWLCAQQLNKALATLYPGAPSCFHYRISGGDEALIVSKELPEDDPHLGAADMTAAIAGADRAVVVAISCGLSAPYVAGQIDAAMRDPRCTAVLIGFNPVELARDVPVEGWDKTCAQVFQELQRRADSGDDRCYVINPVVGPEAVTGSSRMKGGSMTKVLLDTVFIRAIEAAVGLPSVAIRDIVMQYEHVYRETYGDVCGVARLVDIAGQALTPGDAHLYIVGTGSAGLLGSIDASEMVDTYGTRLDEVMGLVEGGWSACFNNEGDMTSHGPLFDIGKLDRALTPADSVILINPDSFRELPKVALEAASTGKLGVLVVSPATAPSAVKDTAGKFGGEIPTAVVEVPTIAVVQTHRAPLLEDFAVKLLLNVVTTGANVRRGAVYGNTMINLTVSNNKLFHRSADIICKITGCAGDIAIASLVRAAHGLDAIPAEIESLPLSVHIEAATPKRNIVPTAALLATGRYTFAEAKNLLSSAGSKPLRQLLQEAICVANQQVEQKH